MAAVTHKDVVLAFLGASAGLSGLVLVFLGLVAAEVASFAAGTKKEIVAKRRRPAFAVLFSFLLGVVCAAAAGAWLLDGGHSGWLYVAMATTFFAQLGSLLVATGWATWRTLWG